MGENNTVEGRLYIITHTDLDGAGSAAAALIALGLTPGDATILYAEPYNLHEILGGIAGYLEKGDLLIISDLGPNRDSYPATINLIRDATSRGVRVEWYDHHIWPEEDKKALESAGGRLIHDTSTCATGVVGRYAPGLHGRERDPFLDELERAVCAADIWRWDHPLAPKLFRVADARYEDGREAWRNRIVEKFASKTLWDDELQAKLEEYVNMELRNYNKLISTAYTTTAGSCRIAATYKTHGPPSNSFIGASLLSRYNAKIAVIVRPNGGLSLRSRDVDVQKVALRLGGGGHPRAAGARIRLPLWVRLARILLGGRIVSRYAAGKVARAALESGVCA